MIQFIKICGGLACTCTVNHIEQNNNNKWISTAIVNNKMIPSWGNDSLLGKWFPLGEFSLPIRSETHIHYVCMFVSLFLLTVFLLSLSTSVKFRNFFLIFSFFFSWTVKLNALLCFGSLKGFNTKFLFFIQHYLVSYFIYVSNISTEQNKFDFLS